jgi:hypothetical protein
VSLDWLAGLDSSTASGALASTNDVDIVQLPRFDAKASAGRGLIPVNEMPIGEVAFARDFLRNLGANPDFAIS